MSSKEVTVANATGLHARPATMLAKKASSFKSDIKFEFNGKSVNGKSLIGILSLGAGKGAVVKVVASGEDEALAAAELAEFISKLEG
jgi:phosphocarrier protein